MNIQQITLQKLTNNSIIFIKFPIPVQRDQRICQHTLWFGQTGWDREQGLIHGPRVPSHVSVSELQTFRSDRPTASACYW